MTPLEASTQFLLHFNSATPDFVDSSARGLTVQNRGAVAVNAGAKFGSHCYDHPGAATSGVGVILTQWTKTIGTLPYSLDLWVYPYALPSGEVWLIGAGYSNFRRPAMMMTAAGKVRLWEADGSNATYFVESVATVPINQWTHLAVCRDSVGVSRIFVGGVLSAVSSTLRNLTDSFEPASGLFNYGVGADPSGGDGSFKGRIDEARVVFYHPTFVQILEPPATAFPDTVGGDALFASVSVLLHGEGANAGTTITDSSDNALTPTQIGTSGNVETSTTSPRFGSASLRFGGTQAISYASSSLFEAASRNWTIESWVNLDASLSGANGRHLWQLFGASVNFRANIYYQPSTNTLALYTENGAGTGGVRISAAAPGLAQWFHLALVKEGTAFTLHINGTPVGSVIDPAFPTGNLGLCLGTQNFSPVAADFLIGNFDEFRVTMGAGAARYPLNFTPPTSAYADPGGVEIPNPLDISVWGKADISPDFGFRIGDVLTPDLSRFLAGRVDLYHGGTGTIFGTTKEKNTPSNTVYAPRRVILIRETDNSCFAQTWSDAGTGYYEFLNIAMGHKYTVVAYDDLGTYRGTLATGVLPTLMT